MLYTVLPALTLCMTLLKGNSTNDPMMNVAVDSNDIGDAFYHTKYLDAAIMLIEAAKSLKEKQGSISKESIHESGSEDNSLEISESDPKDSNDLSSSEVSESDSKDAYDLEDPLLRCPNRPIDCEEWLVECGSTKSGVYRIWPRSRVDTGGDSGFEVYCDMDTDGGGWTVFQRRGDFGTNSDLFYQSWLKYKYGFGNLNFDFWLGNDKIFALSNQRRSMLRFDLIDFANEDGFATYDNFYLDDEKESYRLHFGYYRGNIGDSFSGHNLCKFSTKDRDNDKNFARNCARVYKGGWWYNNCHTVNLNGLYLKGNHSSYANGVNWYDWKGFWYSLKKTEMKLRSSNFRGLSQLEDNLDL